MLHLGISWWLALLIAVLGIAVYVLQGFIQHNNLSEGHYDGESEQSATGVSYWLGYVLTMALVWVMVAASLVVPQKFVLWLILLLFVVMLAVSVFLFIHWSKEDMLLSSGTAGVGDKSSFITLFVLLGVSVLIIVLVLIRAYI
jgi:heme/copper-type cytochrome/quinol oxidase subunit 4